MNYFAMAQPAPENTRPDYRSTHDQDDEKRQPLRDDDLFDDRVPHSLALLPADLEVAIPSSSDKEVYIEEKQPVQVYKESCRISNESTSEKQVCEEVPVAPDGWHTPWSARNMPTRICGMRAKVFWILVASAVIVFGLGIGIGMGTSKLNGDDKRSQSTSAMNATMMASALSTTTV
jgi:hypothetical protein